MDNGGNGYGSGSRSYGNGGKYGTKVRIGGITIDPIIFYVGIGIAALAVLSLLWSMFNTAIVTHFGVAAGVLLLLANVRELIGLSYAQPKGTALLNCMVGGSLVLAWLGEIVLWLFWLPAALLLVAAVPLIIGRTSVYTTYMNTARGAVQNVRRTVSRWN